MCRLAVIDTAEQEALNFTLSGNMDQIMGIYVGFGDSMDHGHLASGMDVGPGWSLVAVQTTDVNMDHIHSTGYRHLHGLQW